MDYAHTRPGRPPEEWQLAAGYFAPVGTNPGTSPSGARQARGGAAGCSRGLQSPNPLRLRYTPVTLDGRGRADWLWGCRLLRDQARRPVACLFTRPTAVRE